jgi:hypothetical protein
MNCFTAWAPQPKLFLDVGWRAKAAKGFCSNNVVKMGEWLYLKMYE